MGVVLLDERITPAMWIGGAIIIISTLMVTVYEKQLLKYFRKNETGAENPGTVPEKSRPAVEY
jgi:hypothetical protein